MRLLSVIESILVLANFGTDIIFRSKEGFQIAYPARCKIDQNEATSVKLYIYLTDTTPVNAVTVSTDDSFNKIATLSSVTEKYADAITSLYQELKVLSKEFTTLTGVAAFHTVYSGIVPVQYDDNVVKEEMLKVNQTWALKDARVYTLTFKTLAEDYDKCLPFALRIMDSFTLSG